MACLYTRIGSAGFFKPERSPPSPLPHPVISLDQGLNMNWGLFVFFFAVAVAFLGVSLALARLIWLPDCLLLKGCKWSLSFKISCHILLRINART